MTHRLTIMLLEQLLRVPGGGFALQDSHVALVESVYEAAILQLRLFYKGSRDEIFLDMFEDEYRNEMVNPWNRIGLMIESVSLHTCVHLLCMYRVWRCVCSTYCRRALCYCLPQTHPSLGLSSHGGCLVERLREHGRFAWLVFWFEVYCNFCRP